MQKHRGTRERHTRKKTAKSSPQPRNKSRHVNRNRLPPLSGQSLQSHPPSLRYMLLSELPNQGLCHGLLQQEPTVGTNNHTLLTPGEHDVRPSLVLHESRGPSPDNRDDDMVTLVSLKRVDVEHGIFPGEVCRFQRGLDRVPLSVVGGDDLEFLPFSDVTASYLHDSSDFSFVLSGRWISATHDRSVSWIDRRTTQLTPLLISFPLLTSTKRQQAMLRIGCTVPSFESYT